MKTYPAPQPRRYVNYVGALLGWLARNEFRRFNGIIRSGEPADIDVEDLVLRFEDLLRANASMAAPGDPRSSDCLTNADVERVARRGAEWVAEHFDPKHLDRCRRGGLKSRRKPTYTVAHLRGLSGSKKAQALALGCSTSTIANLRRELAKRLHALAAKWPGCSPRLLRELIIQNDQTRTGAMGKKH